MPVGRSSATDETRERAEPEGRLLPPRDDPEAGFAKNLVSSGRGNGVPSNRAPELPGKRATRLRARRVDLDSPGVSQAIGRDRTHVARVYLPRNVGLYGTAPSVGSASPGSRTPATGSWQVRPRRSMRQRTGRSCAMVGGGLLGPGSDMELRSGTGSDHASSSGPATGICRHPMRKNPDSRQVGSASPTR